LKKQKNLFERIRLIYTLVEDVCTEEKCPIMSAGSQFEFLWQDNEKYKRPEALPAPQYISCLFSWAEKQLNKESVSLHDIHNTFRRLLRVYAHIYHHHLASFEEMGEMALLRSSLAAFLQFVSHHSLLDPKDLLPLHTEVARHEKLVS